jgi:hypothetical protein
MASIAHPERPDERIGVSVIDSETHGDEYVQIEATDDNVSLSDASGEQPWVPAEEVEGNNDG